MNSVLTRVREWLDKLEPRERRMMGGLGVALAVFLLLLVPVAASFVLSGRRDANRAVSTAVSSIKSARDDVRLRQAKRDAIVARYANRAPALAGVLEKAARENHLDIPESQDRAEIPHGKRYVERTTVIRLRKAGMLQLAKMLEQLEQQRLPISVSRLNIRRRGGERDSYDVELGVSAFDRSETTKDQPPSTGGSK